MLNWSCEHFCCFHFSQGFLESSVDRLFASIPYHEFSDARLRFPWGQMPHVAGSHQFSWQGVTSAMSLYILQNLTQLRCVWNTSTIFISSLNFKLASQSLVLSCVSFVSIVIVLPSQLNVISQLTTIIHSICIAHIARRPKQCSRSTSSWWPLILWLLVSCCFSPVKDLSAEY